MLLIESGKLKTTHTVKNNDGIINEEYTWDVDKDKVNAYVGILYMHDYVNAYPNGMGRRDNVVNSWIHILNNESKHPSEPQELGQESWEFLITRYGYGYKSQNQYSIRYIHSNGAIYEVIPNFRCVVRPVFNINADIKLTGDGTLEKPFTITS